PPIMISDFGIPTPSRADTYPFVDKQALESVCFRSYRNTFNQLDVKKKSTSLLGRICRLACVLQCG
ncbi:MAG: hypothetical protein ACXV49_06510, partial [Halobacteriota archaeon]